jgi:hypothetical protein
MRAEQLLTTTSSKENIMAQAITLTQTRTVEILDADGAASEDFREFLTDTGWVVTRKDDSALGNLHKEGKGPASSSRRLFNKDNYIVKVDGHVVGPVPKHMFATRFPNTFAV